MFHGLLCSLVDCILMPYTYEATCTFAYFCIPTVPLLAQGKLAQDLSEAGNAKREDEAPVSFSPLLPLLPSYDSYPISLAN